MKITTARFGVVSDVGRPGCQFPIGGGGRPRMAFDAAPTTKGRIMDVKDIPAIIAGLRTKFNAEEALHALHVMCGGKVDAEEAEEAERKAAMDSAMRRRATNGSGRPYSEIIAAARNSAARQPTAAESREAFAKRFPNAGPLRII